MIDELAGAQKQIETAIERLHASMRESGRGNAISANSYEAMALKGLEQLHADVMAWRCILIVAKREADRSRDLRRSLIGRAWRRMRAILL